jgi:hypothetical protein
LKKDKKQRLKFYETTAGADIKYRGPLNLTHFKILGWICVVLGQTGILMNVFDKSLKFGDAVYTSIASTFSFFGSFSLILLLISNFALILNSAEDYIKIILKYVALSGAIALLYYYIYDHILSDALVSLYLTLTPGEIIEMFNPKFATSGFFSFNLFIDLLLCTLFLFFIDYRPKKIFTGKALIIFRLFTVFPVSYEIASIVLKFLSASGKFKINPQLFPLLPAKPPVAFFVFLALALFIKIRERICLNHGWTIEEYTEFLKTRRNSFHFGAFSTIVFLIAGILDTILQFVIGLILSFGGEKFTAEGFMDSLKLAERMGFGNTTMLILIAPLMLLFSYNRIYKNQKLINIAVPTMGVGATIFIYVEMSYQTIFKYLSDLFEKFLNTQ